MPTEMCNHYPGQHECEWCRAVPSHDTNRDVRRRHKLPPGECSYCDGVKGDFHPPHDASDRCESGKHNHCSCDECF